MIQEIQKLEKELEWYKNYSEFIAVNHYNENQDACEYADKVTTD
jgi:hypothetical protein